MRTRRSTWTSLIALLPLLAAPLAAEPSIPGAEQRVNERRNLTQRNPVAAFAASGSSLVVWENDLVGLEARRYNRDGSADGPELTLVANQRLASIPASGEIALRKEPALAMFPSGDFLLFWTEERGFLSVDFFFFDYQLISREVVGQRFDASGQPAGERFRVNAGAGLHSLPQVAVRAGDVAVAWSLDDRAARDKAVLLRLFDHRGRATSGEVRVSPVGEVGSFPAVAASRNGRILVAWEGEDGNQRGIQAQVFDGAASSVGGSFRVNTEIVGRQRRAAIAAAGADGFLVLWNGQFERPGRSRIYGQLVGAAGNLVGSEVAVSSGSVEKEVVPAVASGRDGRFLAAWLGYKSIFPVGIFAVELGATGAPVGDEVKLNRRAVGANQFLSVASDGKGGFLVPWQGFIRRQAGISVQRPVQE